MLAPIDKNRPQIDETIAEQINIELKYEGYISRQIKQVEQYKKLEKKKIPADFDYDAVPSLRIEARQKLKKIRPVSIGQASRISGVSPADINVLVVFMKL
jgi:tRNA uridine 5-carboxymethylaminomethyl modification enzyme